MASSGYLPKGSPEREALTRETEAFVERLARKQGVPLSVLYKTDHIKRARPDGKEE